MASLEEVEDQFIGRWGALGTSWGIPKSMGQIQALLIASSEPLTTDDVMARLQISRGNAHGGLKELVTWGLAERVHVKGLRKEFYRGEQDPWRIFHAVVRERRRREIKPLITALNDCVEQAGQIKSTEAEAFTSRIQSLSTMAVWGDRVMQFMEKADQSRLMKWVKRLGVKG